MKLNLPHANRMTNLDLFRHAIFQKRKPISLIVVISQNQEISKSNKMQIRL